jgi:hypothetical protein
MIARTAEIHRETRETNISVGLNLEGTGIAKLGIDIPFLEHMLEQVARHGLIDLTIDAQGMGYQYPTWRSRFPQDSNQQKCWFLEFHDVFQQCGLSSRQ